MSWAARIAGVRRLFRLPVSARPVERDIEEELQFHFQSRVADLVARGASEREARAAAEREYGDIDASRAELAADVLFYVPVIFMYEKTKHWRR